MDQYASLYNASMLVSKHDGDTGDDGFIYGIINANQNNDQSLLFQANGIWGTLPDTAIYVQTGAWYNFIVSYDQSNGLLKYFLNGLPVSALHASLNIIPNLLDLTIGYSQSGSGAYLDYFNGSIDDIRFYNRELNKAEVKFISKH